MYVTTTFVQFQINNQICSVVYYEKNANTVNLNEPVTSINDGFLFFPDNEIPVKFRSPFNDSAQDMLMSNS